jgi:hypothetical protein
MTMAISTDAELMSVLSQEPAAKLIRSIDCFNDAVMFIDVSAPKWKVLHLNSAAQTRLKLHGVSWSTDEGQDSLLWDLFQVSILASK